MNELMGSAVPVKTPFALDGIDSTKAKQNECGKFKSQKDGFKYFMNVICKVNKIGMNLDDVFGLWNFASENEEVEGGVCGNENEECRVCVLAADIECQICMGTRDDGLVILQSFCLCKGTSTKYICENCVEKPWRMMKKRLLEEMEKNKNMSRPYCYKKALNCDLCDHIYGEDFIRKIKNEWEQEIKMKRKEKEMSMESLVEETYFTIVDVETSEKGNTKTTERLNNLKKELEKMKLEGNSDLLLETMTTCCLVHMGNGNFSECLEIGEKLLALVEGCETLHKNEVYWYKIQANVFRCYSLFIGGKTMKMGGKKIAKMIKGMIKQNVGMLKFLEESENMRLMKVDLGTLAEQNENLEYQYFVCNQEIGKASEIGFRLLDDMEMKYGRSFNGWKDFYEKFIQVLFKENDYLELAEKGQLEILASCKWGNEDDSIRIVKGLQMLCCMITSDDRYSDEGKLEFLKSVWWFTTEWNEDVFNGKKDYSMDVMNCRMQVFFEISNVYAKMATKEIYDEKKGAESIFGCQMRFTSEAMMTAIMNSELPQNNVFDDHKMFFIKRQLGISLSYVTGMPANTKRKRLVKSIEFLRDVHDFCVKYGNVTGKKLNLKKEDLWNEVRMSENKYDEFEREQGGGVMNPRVNLLKKLREKTRNKGR